MPRFFDHLVLVCADLDAGVSRFEAGGFAVSEGGRHPSLGTENRLIGLSETGYLELLGFSKPATANQAGHPMWPLAKAGGGLGVFWLSTDNLARDIDAWAATGIVYEQPEEFGRKASDGSEIRFRVSTPNDKAARALPFLIEDVGAPSLRRPTSRSHANGVAGIDEIVCAVDGPELEACYSRFLDMAPDRDARGVRFQLPSVAIVLTEERPAAAHLPDGVGILEASFKLSDGPGRLVIRHDATLHGRDRPG